MLVHAVVIELAPPFRSPRRRGRAAPCGAQLLWRYGYFKLLHSSGRSRARYPSATANGCSILSRS